MKSRPAVSITSASESHEADLNARTRKYLILMAIRMVCFVGAVFAHGWFRWTLVAGAVVLPWIAVLIANAVKRRYQQTDAKPSVPTAGSLGSPSERSQPDHSDVDDPIIIDGEIVEDDDD